MKPTEHLYVVAGNYRQYNNYIKDSELNPITSHYVDTYKDILGIGFNSEKRWQPLPKGPLRKLFKLQPRFVEVPAERINRIAVYGTWRQRKDLDALWNYLQMQGARLPVY